MMKIRRLCDDDYLRERYIWRECFGDSESFLDAYFNYAAAADQGFGLETGGELVADLFMLNFCAKVYGASFPAKFLAGCATLPKARKKNYMKELIRYTLNYLYDNGVFITYLHPFLHEFYRKFGYETIAYVKRYNIKNEADSFDNTAHIAKSLKDTPIAGMIDAYEIKMQDYDNCFMRDHKRFAAWLELLYSDGGKTVYTGVDKDFSYALYYEEDGGIDVFEMVTVNEYTQKKLLNSFGVGSVNYFIPDADNFKTNDNEEFTMARIIDPKAALKKYPFRVKEQFVIHIEDDFLQKDWRFTVRPNENENRIIDTDASPDIDVDINRAAQLITGSYPKDASSSEQYFFKRQSACFFETY